MTMHSPPDLVAAAMSSATTTSKALQPPTSFHLLVLTFFRPLPPSRHSWHHKALVHLSPRVHRVLNSPIRLMRCRITTPILKITNTTDPRTIPATASPRRSSSTPPCSNLRPRKVQVQPNKETSSRTTMAAVCMAVSTNISPAMMSCTNISSIMRRVWVVWAGNTSTRSCMVTRVSKASWGSAKATIRRRGRHLGNALEVRPLRRLTNRTRKTLGSRTAHQALASVLANPKEDGACNRVTVKAVASTVAAPTGSGRLVAVPMGSTNNTNININRVPSRVVHRKATRTWDIHRRTRTGTFISTNRASSKGIGSDLSPYYCFFNHIS